MMPTGLEEEKSMVRLPTIVVPREQLRRTSGWIAILTAVLVIVDWFLDWPYLIGLVLWFFFWLSFGHWNFCRDETFTQTDVRKIDYLYLGAAAISIVLAASQYQATRAQYMQMLDDVFVPSKKSELKEYIDRERTYYCSQIMEEFVPKQYCDWITVLRPFLDTDYSVSDLEARIKGGHELIDAEQWDSFWVALRIFATYGEDEMPRRNFIDPSNSLRDRVRFTLQIQQSVGRAARLIVRSMEKIANTQFKPTTAAPTPAPEGFLPAIGGLGLTAIWPLFLTFALAIRFVKVTAEVSGWVR
jgi:hypothetical protein